LSYSSNSRKKEQRFCDLKPVFFAKKKLSTPAVYFFHLLSLYIVSPKTGFELQQQQQE
jgi:hypothetical protein